MLFGLKKIITYWLMPLPLALVLIIFGVILLKLTRWKKSGRVIALFGGLWLLVCSNSGVGTWLVRGLEDEFPPQPTLLADFPATAASPAPASDSSVPLVPANIPGLPPALARCKFVVVLGGGHGFRPDRSANNQLSSSALSRIVEGVRLVRQMPHARLIVSGPADPDNGGPSHARTLADVAVSLGVERERIIEIDDARDTEEETAEIARRINGAPVALVTSACHMPRSMALAAKQGIESLACPADYAARDPHLRGKDFLAWNLGGLSRSTLAIYEFLGITWSRMRGKL